MVYNYQVILINGQFPGPRLDVVTNDNIVLNLFNKLDEPFLLTWSVSQFSRFLASIYVDVNSTYIFENVGFLKFKIERAELQELLYLKMLGDF